MKKRLFYTEAAYVVGIIVLALGTAFMEVSDFGMSMVVAPAYLLHLKISQLLPFFSFGMAEYTLQAVLIVVMSLVLRRFKMSYLFSFGTAVFYGFVLDGCMALIAPVPADGFALRLVWFLVGMILCAAGVSLLFHTYISPEAYELFVKEIAQKTNREIHVIKTIYDCTSCLIGIALSFLFFGWWHFEGVKLGTVVCALVNGWTISLWTRYFESRFSFGDRWACRKYFE